VPEAPLTVEGFMAVKVAGQWWWHARTEARCSDSDVVGFRHGRQQGENGRAQGEARTASVARRRLCILAGWNGPVGTAFNQHVHVWTAPPTAANQGTARGDPATDR
jgi:hypothetical protein